MTALLAALPAGVVCVTFLIGFASLRIHAERQRAIQRSDEVTREITHASPETTVHDEDVEATYASLSEAMHIDPVARWTIYAASTVSLISIALFAIQVLDEHWTLSLNPAAWNRSFLPLLSMPVFSIIVTSLGWADYAWTIRDLSRRRASSFMETVRKAMTYRNAGHYSEALSESNKLSSTLSRWAWLYAFQSNCLEHLEKYPEATILARKASALNPQNGWYLLQIARLLWEQDKPKEALEIADRAVDILPDEASVRGLRGVIFDRLGKDEEALTDLEIALSDSPTDVTLIKARGASLVRSNVEDLSTRTITQILGEGDEIYIAALRARAHTRLKKRDLEQAIADLDIVINANGSDSEAIAYRALALTLLNNAQAAERDISTYETLLVPNNMAGVVEIGQALYSLKRYDEACGKFTEYLKAMPKSRQALHWRGMAYEELGHVTNAIEDYERRLQEAPEDVHFLVHHGSLMMDIGLTDSALRDLNDAVSLNEKNRYARGVRGSLLASLKRYKEAFNDYDYLVRRNPNDVTALVSRASMYLQLGNLDEALADLASAERIDGSYARIYGVRGIVLGRLDKDEEAVQSLSRAIELAPDDVIAIANRAVSNDNLARPSQAIADYDEAIRLSPANPRLYTQRGCVNFRTGNKLDAIRDYNKALKLVPGDVLALTHRGEWYADAGEFQMAIEDLTQIYDADPSNCPVLSELADAYSGAGDTERALLFRKKAAEDLTRAYESNPSDLSILGQLTTMYSKLGDSDRARSYAETVRDSALEDRSNAQAVAYAWNNEGLAVESGMVFRVLADSDPDDFKNSLAYAISQCQAGHSADGKRLFGGLLSKDRERTIKAWDSLVIPAVLFRYEDVLAVWNDATANPASE
jgi:tetratricopeptide (TPR) repeat protein